MISIIDEFPYLHPLSTCVQALIQFNYYINLRI
nr:MAG TPA: hypothetical protein [Caudoviricetes sp.]